MNDKKTKWIKRILIICTVAVCIAGCGKKDNKEQDALRTYGINCLASGDYEEAIEAFQGALDQNVGSIGEKEIDLCFYKARAQYMGGFEEDAIETYTNIIEYNGSAEAYYLRGNLYFSMGETELALSDYDSAVANDKKNYELYLGIYEAMEAHGMAEDGQKYLNMALEIKGDGGNDLLQKGCIYYYLGEKDKAIELLEDALEKKVYEANFYLAEIYTESGEVERAETYFAAYLESGIADSTSLCKMGENQMACGNYSQAITYFLAALEMEEVPNKQAIMKNVVVSYEELGEFASARAMLEDYVELFPDDEAAARELIFLQTR